VLVSNAGDPLARPPAVQIATKQGLAGDSQPHTLQLGAIQPGSGERGLVWSGCIMRPARSSLDCRIALHPMDRRWAAHRAYASRPNADPSVEICTAACRDRRGSVA
jgi:hypothetical protein